MFKSIIGGYACTLSSVNTEYSFESLVSDENYYAIEVEPDVSDAAKDEAKQLLVSRAIPSNFSNDKELQTYADDLLSGKCEFTLDKFKSLDIIQTFSKNPKHSLEYDEAVLLYLIWQYL